MAVELVKTTLFADANLLAYYKLESTADTRGLYTLTNNGTITFASAMFGNGAELGTANSTKYLSIANDMGITSGAVSISLWAKINTEPGTGVAFSLFERGDAGVDVRHWIRYQDSAGVKSLSFNRQRENTANDSVSYNVTLGTTNWNHIAFTYSGTTVRGWLNGTDVGNVASSGNGASGVDSDYTYIGAARTQAPAVATYASAIIDDVAIFNRELLQADMNKIVASRNLLKQYRRTRFPGAITGL